MAGNHTRNTQPMHAAPRCGARTRAGASCRSPAIGGAKRCRMHGGKGSGAPPGNQNAIKHGRFSREREERRLRVRALIRQAQSMANKVGLDQG